MKKIFSMILLAVMLFALCACGSGEVSPAAEPAPAAASPASASEPDEEPLPDLFEDDNTPVEEPAEPAAETNELFEKALSFVDKDVNELIAAIGEPNDSDYMPSCMGDGDDGELYYDGFYVATYREGNDEVVIDVIQD